MPRYHFDLVDSKTIADESGAEASSDMHAIDIGQHIARRLVAERPKLRERRYKILISNEDGDTVHRIALDTVQ